MSADSLAFASASELAGRIARREISPVDPLREILERIERIDSRLGCYVEVWADSASRDARAAEAEIARGSARGPLHGVPVALKDIFSVAGERCAAGSKILLDQRAERDAHVVARLKSSGAVLIGRLAMHEFAYGLTTTNPHFGACRNPWNVERVPGGSSGGSAAALAAGLAALSLGTDTGGSIRIPAAACGVVGLKPTFGRVSRRGVVPLAWSLDHVGPLARSVEDAALALAVVGAPDPEDPWCTTRPRADWTEGLEAGVRGLRLGVPRRHFFEGLAASVARAVEDAIQVLAREGASIVEVELPHLEHAYTAFHAILASEASAYHRPWLASRPLDYGDDVRAGLELGALIPAVDYVDARHMQTVVRAEFAAALAATDALLTPTLPRGAPRIGEPMTREPSAAWNRLVAPFNLAGVPAISLPCGFDEDAMPVGLHVAGRWFEEATVLRVARAYERATRWSEARPTSLE